MKINELFFRNHATKWELEKTTFGDLTLLVGVSGVGKTQILKSIQNLVDISEGKALNGVEWDLRFTTKDGGRYQWKGIFEVTKDAAQEPKILNETLSLEDKLIFTRAENTVKYEEKDVPKVTPHLSVLSLFTSEDKIIPVKEGFNQITLVDYSIEQKLYVPVKDSLAFVKAFEEDSSKASVEGGKIAKSKLIGAIKKNPFYLMFKLFVISELFNDKFVEIVDEFKNLFPQIEDVRFVQENVKEYELKLKEKGTGWIPQREISSGMFKTLMHIVELKLTADGFVVLIDEFENSLGVNCIDTVADNLTVPGRDIQYIVTSHHPYIINNIAMKYWKVVTRKGSKVSTINAEQLGLGKSKHEAFKQLLNLEAFAEGIS